MADESKFKFISPGIFLNEIDQSQIPALPDAVGPVIIGRAQRGPAFAPTKVNSFSELTSIFGLPLPGNQQPADTWREGAQNAPLYAMYAAQAYLAAGVAPVSFVRLLGLDSDNAVASETTLAEAGWQITTTTDATTAANTAGAYGLMYFGSGSNTAITGTLGAVLYMSGCAIYPTGTLHDGTTDSGMNKIFDLGTTKDFTLILSQSATAGTPYQVSLEESNPNFIRDLFSTNPQIGEFTSNRVVTSVESADLQKKYWLGETFERTVKEQIFDKHDNYGVAIVPLMSASATDGPADRRSEFRNAHSPWVISQQLSTDTASFDPTDTTQVKRLFKLITLDGQGEYANRRLKVSIDNINYSPNDNVDYGSFDVLLRDATDSDLKLKVLERFSGCNLNPLSSNYIVNKIGDRYQQYDSNTGLMRTIGDIPNNSNYVRVHVHDEVANGANSPSALPFGFYGIPQYNNVTFTADTATNPSTYINKGGYLSGTLGEVLSSSLSGGLSIKLEFPAIPLRASSIDGGTAGSTAFFGLDTGKAAGNPVNGKGYVDYTRFMGAQVVPTTAWGDNFGLTAPTAGTQLQTAFTLDNVVLTTGSAYDFSASPTRNITYATYTTGSRVAGTSWTASNSAGTSNYQNILKSGFKRFTMPMFGGFDGFSVFEREPLRNNLMDDSSQAAANRDTNYVINTYETALDIISDTESYEFNVASIPGVWYETLTKKLIDVCEARGDALGVIDLKGGYLPHHEIYKADKASRRGDVQQVLNNIDSRNLNNSYGATYYPWVTVRDSVNNTILKVPASVVALGVLANTERVADVWFAPAGFNRGGLSDGAAGLAVLSTDEKLIASDRDNLYSRNINPIASFPAEGIVIFGQKTLQTTQSALDRINVRRLLIYLKKGISRIASTVLFEQNVQTTWNDFKSRSDSFLGDVKVRFGVDDFRVVLDETTTTPDLVDRNIMYAKIFIKPTRSIEFIALDFIITRSGASFED